MTDVDDWRDPDPGLPREEPDFEAEAHWAHLEEAHDGKPCNCPLPTKEEIEAQWEKEAAEHRAGFHRGAECNCVAPF